MAGNSVITLAREDKCNSGRGIKQANSAALAAHDMLSFLTAALQDGTEYSPEEMEGAVRIIAICRDQVWDVIENLPNTQEVSHG